MTTIAAIVGRPNVGKSTLFNRLSRSRNALVDDQPGVTRDRLYATIRWDKKELTLVDTGGFDDTLTETFMAQVREQVSQAIAEANIILFMVDGKEGLMPGDEEIAHLLRQKEKEVFLVANKIDGAEQEHLTFDFYRLGWHKVYPLSAAHGYGLRSLMAEVSSHIPERKTTEVAQDEIRVAILGRPNAGKSSLINRILGWNRMVVSDAPGTTRDTVDTLFDWNNQRYRFIDTAGLRRKARVREKLDKFSMIKTIRTLDRTHIALILIDGTERVTDQDARICGYALDRGCGLLLGLNKWDLVKKDPYQKKILQDSYERQLKFVSFSPTLYLSAKTGEGVKKIFDVSARLFTQFTSRKQTADVNRVVYDITQKKPPPASRKGKVNFFYSTQITTAPPTFVVFVNRPDLIHFSYKRFMVNQLREHFKLDHTPIRLIFRKKTKNTSGP
jgi:GTP-binding protein